MPNHFKDLIEHNQKIIDLSVQAAANIVIRDGVHDKWDRVHQINSNYSLQTEMEKVSD